MKILQINCVYNTGSTGKIMCDIRTGLISDGIDCVIVYGRGADTGDAGVYRVGSEIYSKANNLLSRFDGYAYGGCRASTKKIISIIEKEEPDIVHVHCINNHFVNVYELMAYLNATKIRTVLTLHAEFMHTANCAHALDCDRWLDGCGSCPRLREATGSYFIDRTHESWMKMKKAFEGFDHITVVSVSPWLEGRARRSPIMSSLGHTTVLNGLDTQVFRSCFDESIRRQYADDGEKIVFHATAMFSDKAGHFKGGEYIIDLASRLPSVRFLVAGKSDVEGANLPDNLVLLGNVSDQKKLAQLYSISDLTVIASKKETFSMICAESLCCGTPVVGFEAGAPEQISLEDYSEFVKYGDGEALYNTVSDFLAADHDRAKIEKLAHARYAKETMYAEYKKIYLGEGGTASE